ncbi:calcium-transporting ATPase 1 family protein, partial [Tanacetum coccineum]
DEGLHDFKKIAAFDFDGCLAKTLDQRHRIGTLEFDGDRKSIGVIMLLNSGKTWLLVKSKEDSVLRAEPRHKLEIVRLLKDVGIVFVMTGDGVNAREEARDREWQ